MSKLLFRLRNVSDDEAEEVRQLLDDNEIAYFETSPGNWGISMPAIWVKEDAQYKQARRLLDQYQSERTIRIRQAYEISKERGETRTSWEVFRENPLKFISYLVLIGVVLYLSLRFFLSF